MSNKVRVQFSPFRVYNNGARAFKYISYIRPWEVDSLYNLSIDENLESLPEMSSRNMLLVFGKGGFNRHALSGSITFNPLSIPMTHTEGAVAEFGCYSSRIMHRWFPFFKEKRLYIIKPHIIPYVEDFAQPFSVLAEKDMIRRK